MTKASAIYNEKDQTLIVNKFVWNVLRIEGNYYVIHHPDHGQFIYKRF